MKQFLFDKNKCPKCSGDVNMARTPVFPKDRRRKSTQDKMAVKCLNNECGHILLEDTETLEKKGDIQKEELRELKLLDKLTSKGAWSIVEDDY